MAHWRPIVGLDRWTIGVTWEPRPDHDDVPAGFVGSPEYCAAQIFVNVPLLMESEYVQSPQHLSWLVLHELCHGLTWEIVEHAEPLARTEPFRKSMERNTCMIARAIWVAHTGVEPPE
jgi:hypothetical protein